MILNKVRQFAVDRILSLTITDHPYWDTRIGLTGAAGLHFELRPRHPRPRPAIIEGEGPRRSSKDFFRLVTPVVTILGYQRTLGAIGCVETGMV